MGIPLFEIMASQERERKVNHFMAVVNNIVRDCQKSSKQAVSRREYNRKLENALKHIQDIMCQTTGVFQEINNSHLKNLKKVVELEEFKERVQEKKKLRRKQYKINQKLRKEIDFSQEIDQVDHGGV